MTNTRLAPTESPKLSGVLPQDAFQMKVQPAGDSTLRVSHPLRVHCHIVTVYVITISFVGVRTVQ